MRKYNLQYNLLHFELICSIYLLNQAKKLNFPLFNSPILKDVLADFSVLESFIYFSFRTLLQRHPQTVMLEVCWNHFANRKFICSVAEEILNASVVFALRLENGNRPQLSRPACALSLSVISFYLSISLRVSVSRTRSKRHQLGIVESDGLGHPQSEWVCRRRQSASHIRACVLCRGLPLSRVSVCMCVYVVVYHVWCVWIMLEFV